MGVNLRKHPTHRIQKTAFKASSKVHTGTKQAVEQYKAELYHHSISKISEKNEHVNQRLMYYKVYDKVKVFIVQNLYAKTFYLL